METGHPMVQKQVRNEEGTGIIYRRSRRGWREVQAPAPDLDGKYILKHTYMKYTINECFIYFTIFALPQLTQSSAS